ncbi:hypothetical protein Ac2012v2_006416 [Leucoagaricus gongylophorus]
MRSAILSTLFATLLCVAVISAVPLERTECQNRDGDAEGIISLCVGKRTEDYSAPGWKREDASAPTWKSNAIAPPWRRSDAAAPEWR